MKKTKNNKSLLQYELKALRRYTSDGVISTSHIGVMDTDARDLLLEMRGWLLQSDKPYMADRVMKLIGHEPRQIRLDLLKAAADPVLNTLLFKTSKIPKEYEEKREELCRQVPIVTAILLYGMLEHSGRIHGEIRHKYRMKSPTFLYRLHKETKDILGSISCIYQGYMHQDLPKLLYLSLNICPMYYLPRNKKRGYPPTILYMLQKYKEIKENDQRRKINRNKNRRERYQYLKSKTASDLFYEEPIL